MAKNTRIVKIRESILEENRIEAREIRSRLDTESARMVNVMASPGAGKTSLILATAPLLSDCRSFGRAAPPRIAVIEADIDSTVDSDRIIAAGYPAVQIETGGFCHVDATMVGAALDGLAQQLASEPRADHPITPIDQHNVIDRAVSKLRDPCNPGAPSAAGAEGLGPVDLIFLENVGNLICTAQHETGAHLNLAILSVPEGDDKPLKYPVMFHAADVVVINKLDYLEIAEFDLDAAVRRIGALNSAAPVFPVSCRTGAGMQEWAAWLCRRFADSG